MIKYRYLSVNLLTYIFLSFFLSFFIFFYVVVQRHPHVLNLNDWKVSLRPHRLRCCGICSSSSHSTAEEEQKESEDELLTLREWDNLTNKSMIIFVFQ